MLTSARTVLTTGYEKFNSFPAKRELGEGLVEDAKEPSIFLRKLSLDWIGGNDEFDGFSETRHQLTWAVLCQPLCPWNCKIHCEFPASLRDCGGARLIACPEGGRPGHGVRSGGLS